MPSIHPDYTYDIFISYRHNDNIDGWVSRFVEALQNELKATLKNEVSIYFDENPHDGLLETHQVEASLAKKLKCLVFIPIISQTYCDESSFAWEHEFLPFVEMAKEDELGMNITLSNGNVASRVLPVKIHRLDSEDQNTLEAVLDGPLRSIDFIYHEPGVNRPLANDDMKEENLNSTNYKNQVNKVANALKDIGLSIISQAEGKVKLPELKIERPPVTKSKNKGLVIGLGIIALAMILYWGYTELFNTPKAEVEDVTIAVLSFDYQSSEDDQEWLGNGFPGAIRDVLNNVNGLQVIGKASSQSFKGKNATIKEIGEVLNADVLVGGSVRKIGKTLRVNVHLTDVETELQIWDEKYDREWGDINLIMDEVAGSIVGALKIKLSIEELEDIKVAYDVDPEAYEYFLKGEYLLWTRFIPVRDKRDFIRAEEMFNMAIKLDSAYSDAYAGLANLYEHLGDQLPEYKLKRDSVVKLGKTVSPNSVYLNYIDGFRYLDERNIDSALYFFIKAHNVEPDNQAFLNSIIDALLRIGLNHESNAMSKKVLRSDPLNIISLFNYAMSLQSLGEYDLAKEQLIKIIEIEPLMPYTYAPLIVMSIIQDNNLIEAHRIYGIAQNLGTKSDLKFQESLILAAEGKREHALRTNKSLEVYSILGMKKEALNLIDSSNSATNFTGTYYSYNYNFLTNAKVTEFIRDEPKFQEILARAKKVHEERVAKYSHYFDEE